jgi:UDP-N-acetylmuramate dehydrogenase
MGFEDIRSKICPEAEMSKYTTFRTGGTVSELVLCEDEKDLKSLVDMCVEQKSGMFVIGEGSNTLFRDGAHDIFVVKLAGEVFKRIACLDNVVIAGAGAKLVDVINYAVEKGLKGLEDMAGIPASIGGAVFMNAGCLRSISECIKLVRVMNGHGEIYEIDKKDLTPGYRSLGLEQVIILEVEFELEKVDPEKLLKDYKAMIKEKLTKQPYDKPSAGCVFKNPDVEGVFAGELIEQCGLKGLVYGGAKISDVHANFIVNENNASTKDILFLINKVKAVVKEVKDIDLEEEIVIV